LRSTMFAARAAMVMAERGSSAFRGIHRSRRRTRVATIRHPTGNAGDLKATIHVCGKRA
jgi:hypothetical protein